MFHQRQEKEQMDKEVQQRDRDVHQANKEADRSFTETQQLKAQRTREDLTKIRDFNVTQKVTSQEVLHHQ